MAAAEPTDQRRLTSLFGRHQALGAKFAPFGGWQMPIEYAGQGVRAEHQAVRERVGVFDVSHLGKIGVRGPGAATFVDRCLTNSLARIEPGKAQYTLCCNDSGGVVDDLIAYLRADDDVLLVPNAANSAEVARRLRAAAPDVVDVLDEHERLAVLAVQGPACDEVLDSLGLPTGHDYMSFADATWHDAPVTVCRTGYTGERGYELLPGWEAAGPLWDAILHSARTLGGLPCGLGARDTLRTEMGYALHGHELSPDITPVQTGLGWAVGWRKPDFWGRTALLQERERGPTVRLCGLIATGRGVPRPRMDVIGQGGAVLGRTTSGTFSPTRQTGIALALLDASVNVGAEVSVDVRGRALTCEVIRPPFVDRPTGG